MQNQTSTRGGLKLVERATWATALIFTGLASFRFAHKNSPESKETPLVVREPATSPDKKNHSVIDNMYDCGWLRQEAIFDELLKSEFEKAKTLNPALQNLNFEDARQRYFEPVLERVQKAYQADTAPAKHPIIRLKRAFDAEFGDLPYNANNDNMFQSIVPGPDGTRKNQCWSGTRMFLMCAARCIHLTDNEKFIYVFTDRHIFAGVLRSDGEITAVESTVKGGTVQFSEGDNTQGVPLRVVDAVQEEGITLLGERAQNPLGVVLYDTVPPDIAKIDPRQHFQNFFISSGLTKIPEGDIVKQTIAEIPIDDYAAGGGVYSRPTNANVILLRTSTPGASRTVVTPKTEFTKEELQIYRDYVEVHSELLKKISSLQEGAAANRAEAKLMLDPSEIKRRAEEIIDAKRHPHRGTPDRSVTMSFGAEADWKNYVKERDVVRRYEAFSSLLKVKDLSTENVWEPAALEIKLHQALAEAASAENDLFQGFDQQDRAVQEYIKQHAPELSTK